jgi:hypothetical protein
MTIGRLMLVQAVASAAVRAFLPQSPPAEKAAAREQRFPGILSLLF